MKVKMNNTDFEKERKYALEFNQLLIKKIKSMKT